MLFNDSSLLLHVLLVGSDRRNGNGFFFDSFAGDDMYDIVFIGDGFVAFGAGFSS